MTTAAPIINPSAFLNPINSAAKAVTITVASGTPTPATRGLGINCTVAGTATLTMTNGGSMVVTTAVGFVWYPFSVIGVSASTGTSTYYGLY